MCGCSSLKLYTLHQLISCGYLKNTFSDEENKVLFVTVVKIIGLTSITSHFDVSVMIKMNCIGQEWQR